MLILNILCPRAVLRGAGAAITVGGKCARTFSRHQAGTPDPRPPAGIGRATAVDTYGAVRFR